jgi:hypothetical protein
MIVDLAKLAKRLAPLPDDNEPALVRIDEARGFTKDNVIVLSKRAERALELCTPAERVAVMESMRT